MLRHWLCALAIAAALFTTAPGVAADSSRRIGAVLGVEGNAYVGRAGQDRPRAVARDEPIFLDDAIETQPNSRIQLLLDQDVVVTLGESTRLAFPAPAGAAARNGSVPLSPVLYRGRARVLIGHASPEATALHLRLPHSLLIIGQGYAAAWVSESPGHPDAKSGAHWPMTRSTGAANIGTQGSMVFRWAQEETLINPGSFVIAESEGRPYAPSTLVGNQIVQRLLADTQMKPAARMEPPKAFLHALRQDLLYQGEAPTTALTAPTSGPLFTPPAVLSGVVGDTASATTSVGSGINTAPSGPSPSPVQGASQPTPLSSPTPPSVVGPQAPRPAPFPQAQISDLLDTIGSGKKGKK